MSSVQQLLTAIDAVKSANPQAKVTVTVLPSQVSRKRKSLIWYTLHAPLTHTNTMATKKQQTHKTSGNNKRKATGLARTINQRKASTARRGKRK